MLTAANVNLIAASSYCLLIMVVSHCSENELAVAGSYCVLIMVVSHCSENELAAMSSYCLLLAVVLLKHLKYIHASTKTIAELSKNIKPH